MLKKYATFLTSFLLAGLVCLFVFHFVVVRSKVISEIKKEIIKVQENLNEAGYDIAYEDLKFSKLSFFVLKISSLKIYSLDADNYFEWQIPEVKINTGLFCSKNVYVSLSNNQYFQKGTKNYIADFPDLNIVMSFNSDIGLEKLNISGKNLGIENLFSVGDLKLSIQGTAPKQNGEIAPFFENSLELRKIRLADDVNFPLSKSIERFKLDTNVEGVIKSEASYRKTLLAWMSRGGVIDVKKLILNWDPLTLVSRGDLYFNDNLEPHLHLAASAKGLLESLQPLEEQNMLDSKGIFVVKVMLNSKAFRINDTDMYTTVTTPINLTPHALEIENISLMKF